MDQFSSIQRSTRAKRDERRVDEIQKADFLFNSLIDFCFHIQNFGELTQNSTLEEHYTWVTTKTSANNATNTSAPTTAPSDDTIANSPEALVSPKMNEFPKVRPLRLDAVKDGEQIHLLFHVNHSTPVEMTRIAAFDMEKYNALNEAGDLKRMIQSLVNLKVITSAYCEKDYEIDNMFIFESLSKPDNGVNIQVDVCGNNNRQRNRSEGLERFRRQVQVDVVSEDIQLPRFRIDSFHIADGIVAFPGMNTTVDVSVEPDTMSYMIVSVIFHDRAQREMVKDEYRLDFSDGNLDVIRRTSRENSELLSVNFWHSTNSSNGDTSEGGMPDEGENVKKRVPLRITLHTDSGQLAGKLYLEAWNLRGDEDHRELINSASVYHVIQIKKPRNRRVFPRRRVYIEDHSM